ncbi:hypothetical protein [Psychroflexus sp. ALD_RP9]|uniref:hypothetical protein n=1 Tax=Psychroflexus sp. ALD_RP9 TaxID=2777186 RepID=UPI001A8BFF6D|nr:hypothetical protein [Psychroflexus sp. ALD_RP9]QSS96574.1 hypothetical protein IMZ30_08985 [Psychroflexus sp. ALD_RP9]
MTKHEILKLSTQELYDKILEFFDIRELISPGAYQKYAHYGNNFILSRFDKRLLENLLWIRVNIDASITVNTWLWGGGFDERGIRDTSTPMLQTRADNDDAWLSGHVLSMALDYDVEGQTAKEHREWLKEHADEIPHPIRLERKYNGKQITWVHLDVCEDPKNPKVYEFDI